ncbi:MAG: magnesium-translocating P-type ATPase [Verrucomicrobia bacterium]|nr:magnesium-translocating P-type ATPase [Verrucomicrobiota bacterium]
MFECRRARRPLPTAVDQPAHSFWSRSPEELLASLGSRATGLTAGEAGRRLRSPGSSSLNPRHRSSALWLLVAQFKNPIVLLLLLATGLSFALRDTADAGIILSIVIASSLLGFWQEHRAAGAVEQLLALVQIKATVLRDGRPLEVPCEEVVPGDMVVLNAGDVVPGDCRLLESKELFVDEAALTGETFPVEKSVATLAATTPLAQRTNSLFMGTHVTSGTATALVVFTGAETEFGHISERLKLRPPETDFERGVRRFGYLLLEVTLLLVISIFAINVLLGRPALNSFLFALALAVGLTPQLLPAIISVNLAQGARRMAGQRVIVKRLAAIENFGSMDVFCADKTGTLTEGVATLHVALSPDGAPSEKTLRCAWLNSIHETGYTNPIDTAIRNAGAFDKTGYQKLDEEPYDFHRRRMSVLLARGNERWMFTKGALRNVLEVCSHAETAGGAAVEIAAVRHGIEAKFDEFSRDGFRTLGVATRRLANQSDIARDDECGMTFVGFLLFTDPLRTGIAGTLHDLQRLGIRVKIITGDHHLVATHVSREAGLGHARVLTGAALGRMSEAALVRRAGDVDVFAEVEPNQKERIVRALRQAGHVVGYMGDGINDAPALHAADVSISVADAVDVAKEAADIVLLEKNLAVLERGVREGRLTFANTLKYVFMATSANFGNMFSMAGASLFLPFLPLLPKQILLLNLLTDFPEMTIATDHVDEDWIAKPIRWNLQFIRRFMVSFGLVSSLFDYLTFGLLLMLFRASPEEFRTGWFLESVISAALIVLVIRTRQPFYRSRPARPLWLATAGVIAVAAVLPFTPLAPLLGFQAVPAWLLAAVLGIVTAYVLTAEAVKKIFYRHAKF